MKISEEATILDKLEKKVAEQAIEILTLITERDGLYEWQCKRCKGTGGEPGSCKECNGTGKQP